ncbi:OmpA family protein [Glycomyces sp. MUSA5-2]|uniref:OmpA family protein n=1 Tax=Glycomyces sp. MUSA5-2 TaxID=2053002 RepID=UPI0030090796
MTAATTRAALAEAAGHARAGRYDLARRALEPVGDDADALDLLARVHAQQGDLAAADGYWARVQALDPAHEGAREGRRRIRRIWSRRPKPVARRVGAVAAVLLLIAAGTAAGRLLSPAPEEGRAVADELDRLASAVDALESTGAPEPTEAPSTVSPLDPVLASLQDPRWTATAEDGRVSVVLDESLFPDGGTALPDDSGALLADLAAAVEGFHVTVVGHTNDIPTGPGSRYDDNAALGLARALAAAQALADADGPALADIGIATAGDEDPPYPNDTEADRTRNQTVTFLVTP